MDTDRSTKKKNSAMWSQVVSVLVRLLGRERGKGWVRIPMSHPGVQLLFSVL